MRPYPAFYRPRVSVRLRPMGVSRWFNISLAAKCQLLFGVAVLLIVAATLFLPWRWNPYLSAEAD